LVPGAVLHLWHGETTNRGYSSRNRDMQTYGYDPSRHLQDGRNGLWSLSEDGAPLSDWASEYFRDRREDSTQSFPSR
jgi:hypothetical protein